MGDGTDISGSSAQQDPSKFYSSLQNQDEESETDINADPNFKNAQIINKQAGTGAGGTAVQDAGKGSSQASSDQTAIQNLEQFVKGGGLTYSQASTVQAQVQKFEQILNTQGPEALKNAMVQDLLSAASGVSGGAAIIDKFLNSLNQSNPQLAIPTSTGASPSHAISEIKGNPFFSSTFMTALVNSFLHIIKMKMEQTTIEAIMQAKQLNMEWSTAQTLGQLAQQIADNEAAMYTAMAVCAIVSGAMSIGSSLVGIGGGIAKGVGGFSGIKAGRMEAENEAEGGAGGVKGSSEDEASTGKGGTPEEIAALKKKQVSYTMAGDILQPLSSGLSTTAQQGGTAATDLVQAYFTVIKGALERQQKIMEGFQEILKQVEQSTQQDLQDSISSVPQIASLFQKIQDETARAFSATGG